MALRDHIKENHDLAEKHPFVKLLFSGGVSSKIYAEYLFNQYLMYNALEKLAFQEGLLEGVEDVLRAKLILEDFIELKETDIKIHDCTLDYIRYVNTRVAKKNLMAHIYVRHFGDLFGGQMMKKVVVGSGKMYDFKNRSELIKELRSRLDDSLAKEANTVMLWAINLFMSIADEHDIR
jgi:heme oxygenase